MSDVIIGFILGYAISIVVYFLKNVNWSMVRNKSIAVINIIRSAEYTTIAKRGDNHYTISFSHGKHIPDHRDLLSQLIKESNIQPYQEEDDIILNILQDIHNRKN